MHADAIIAQLRATLGKMEVALGAISEAIVWVDAQHRIEWCNAPFDRLVGKRHISILGGDITTLLPLLKDGEPVPHMQHPASVSSSAPERGSAIYEFRIGEEFRYLDIFRARVQLSAGEAGVELVIHDITDRRRTERALQRETSYVELLKAVAVAANEATHLEEAVEICLRRICETTGWPIGHLYLVSQTLPRELIPSFIWYVEDAEQFRAFQENTELTRLAVGIGLPGMVLLTGLPRWIRDVSECDNFPRREYARESGLKAGFAFPVVSGSEIVAVLEFFSSTAAEPNDSLLGVMAQIGTQLGRLVERARADEELRNFATKLKRSNEELERFASVASHDLQEPLRKIQAFGDRLNTVCANALDERGADYLARMLSAAGRMRTLIDDLLAFSRVTTKVQPFTAVDLAETAQQVLSDLETRIDELKATVQIGFLPIIEADPLQMRQLLQNLISNALKFHRSGVPPLIQISARAVVRSGPGGLPDNDWFEIAVQDNGIGFEEKYLDRIFEVFQRLHGRTEYEGSGVGLAICRRIAERHGGGITAESRPSNGATFKVTLPARQKQAEKEES